MTTPWPLPRLGPCGDGGCGGTGGVSRVPGWGWGLFQADLGVPGGVWRVSQGDLGVPERVWVCLKGIWGSEEGFGGVSGGFGLPGGVPGGFWGVPVVLGGLTPEVELLQGLPRDWGAAAIRERRLLQHGPGGTEPPQGQLAGSGGTQALGGGGGDTHTQHPDTRTPPQGPPGTPVMWVPMSPGCLGGGSQPSGGTCRSPAPPPARGRW